MIKTDNIVAMSDQINQTFKVVIRVPKEESAFTYFQLEANEGLCFYSTLESSLKEGYRDIEIQGDLSLKDEAFKLIEILKKSIPITVIS